MHWILIALFGLAQTAQTLNNQGNQLSESRQFAAAEPPYRDSIAIWRGLGPAYEAHLAGTLVNLGVTVSGLGRRDEAADLYEEALTLHRRTLGIGNLRALSNLNLLANTELLLGRRQRAEALLREALPIERQRFPADIQTARTLEILSNLMTFGASPADALALGEEALTIATKAEGEDSLDAALAYSSVAEAWLYAGNVDRALPLFRHSRALYERVLGPEHPRAASLLSREGVALMKDGKLSLAAKSMETAVKYLRKTCPNCTAELAAAEGNLARLRAQQRAAIPNSTRSFR